MTLVQNFLNYVNASPTPFHAVENAKNILRQKGFKELSENFDLQQISSGQSYFLTRNQTSLLAFSVGKKYKKGNGFSIIAAHTDSPCLKLKPNSKKEAHGYLQVGVQTYGGGLWHTWFDRDLSLAGRVIVKNSNESLTSKLVHIQRPLMRIPTLAIHLDRSVNDSFKFNNETQLTPILATQVEHALNQKTDSKNNKHHSCLLELLAKELKVEVDSIIDFELCLFDTQLATVGGLYQEFIFSPRLDNLLMSFTSLQALLGSSSDLENETNVRVCVLYDNEEVGSESAHGACSTFLPAFLQRMSDNQLHDAMLKSLLISADMAHALHPNYADKHESQHQPHFHKGIVIKQNANQRYATTAITSSILKLLSAEELQEFVVRNDSPCGSTIGPMVSAQLGLRTVDVGIPQLSMHSIREMCGTRDLEKAVTLFEKFYSSFSKLQVQLE